MCYSLWPLIDFVYQLFFDSETWNNILHNSQVLTTRDNSRFDPTTKNSHVDMKMPINKATYLKNLMIDPKKVSI